MTTNNKPLRFGVIGCGFWAQTQLHAWQEIPEVELAAVCDIDAAKAEQTARTRPPVRKKSSCSTIGETRPVNWTILITSPS